VTHRGGSCDAAAGAAAAALLELGATRLQAAYAAHVARFGDHCWQIDRVVRDVLRKPGGGRYHRESIGRARRQLVQRGLIVSVRIFAGQKPPGARHASAHGTTSNAIRWTKLGVKNPLTRAQRRQARSNAESAVRPIARRRRRALELPSGPVHSAPPPTLPPELARMVGEAERALSRRWEASELELEQLEQEHDAGQLERVLELARAGPGPDPPD
jgi:hypothetical protein